ncbi:MAG: YdcF family protein [candidate division NC10 bacterium]|nr:YdcF family protein [candidate division NC10 bacterium]
MSVRTSAWWRRALVPFLILVLVGVLSMQGIRGLGQWLVVADPLERARAIVVLTGHVPLRAMEAASIYRQGWAPEVWLTTEARSAEEAAMARLGLQVTRGETYNRAVLERLGVPHEAIRMLSEGAHNTAEEVKLVARELERAGGGSDRVIVVTSKAHTRRVRALWRALVGNSPRAIVRYAADDPYDPGRWWRHTGDALAVSREVFGLMNLWAGFPLQPDRR